ncbi:hypothetical protein T12_13665 [Trichinella patagoniensis]|uniref:Uncharacterized protein n=1 Tax=Trichinella patagoniensis TaxID=990121 RepID=A0A0V1AAS8_9BILA|nr:hypothetical protein T12_13665 [Trichinella patagoniensis]
MENAEVMVDDGGADLFNICTLLIGSFCNISSDSVRGVENRADCLLHFLLPGFALSGLGVAEGGPVRCGARTFGRFVVRLGFSIFDSEDFFKAAMFRSSSELTELGITEFWKVICMASTPGCCQSTDDHVSHYKLAPEFAPDSGIYSSGTMQSKPKRTLKNT